MSRPRIRTLKPDIWQHYKIGRLSHSERLLYVGLLTMADDEGRLRELPSAILGHCFPYDTVSPRRLDKWLTGLERAGAIYRYSAGGDRIIEVHNWSRHQRINRPTPSDLPGRDTPEQQAIFSEDSRRPHDRKGREGMRKGRDEEGSALRARVAAIIGVFSDFGIALTDVEAANALSRFPTVPDPIGVSRGCAQYLAAHPDKPPGLTLHRFFEHELKPGRTLAQTHGEEWGEDLEALLREAG